MESLSKKSGGSVAPQNEDKDLARLVEKLARVWPLPDAVRSGLEAMLDALPAPRDPA